jgi:hypothetical protein
MLGLKSVLPKPRRLMGGLAVLQSRLWLCRLGHETHFLAIPALAAPAQAFGVDDASAGAAAPWIV